MLSARSSSCLYNYCPDLIFVTSFGGIGSAAGERIKPALAAWGVMTCCVPPSMVGSGWAGPMKGGCPVCWGYA